MCGRTYLSTAEHIGHAIGSPLQSRVHVPHGTWCVRITYDHLCPCKCNKPIIIKEKGQQIHTLNTLHRLSNCSVLAVSLGNAYRGRMNSLAGVPLLSSQNFGPQVDGIFTLIARRQTEARVAFERIRTKLVYFNPS